MCKCANVHVDPLVFIVLSAEYFTDAKPPLVVMCPHSKTNTHTQKAKPKQPAIKKSTCIHNRNRKVFYSWTIAVFSLYLSLVLTHSTWLCHAIRLVDFFTFLCLYQIYHLCAWLFVSIFVWPFFLVLLIMFIFAHYLSSLFLLRARMCSFFL